VCSSRTLLVVVYLPVFFFYLYPYLYDSVLVVTNVFVTAVLYYSYTNSSYSYIICSAHTIGIICTGTLLVLYNKVLSCPMHVGIVCTGALLVLYYQVL
jgi:hypothetical protein